MDLSASQVTSRAICRYLWFKSSLLDNSNAPRYYCPCVIKTFHDRNTERAFHREPTRYFPENILPACRRKLQILNAAGALSDLRVPPGNRLEALRGDRDGQYSIRVNDQWRICFRWDGSDAYDVEIVDYY